MGKIATKLQVDLRRNVDRCLEKNRKDKRKPKTKGLWRDKKLEDKISMLQKVVSEMEEMKEKLEKK